MPAQPVHGDAHLGNALAGGVWLDIDEACLAPPAWDLACLRHRTVCFGELADETSEAVSDKPIGPRTWRRLDWLRRRYGG